MSRTAAAPAPAPSLHPLLGPPQQLLEDLTASQREAVTHAGGPLLVVAGAGTGKTTVITRRIAWMLRSSIARADQVLALTFTEKACAEMEERIDLLVPYGYVDVTVSTFHAFGDWLLRAHAVHAGLSPQFRVLSKPEQAVFLKQHIFELPLSQFRPLSDPTRFAEALVSLFSRAKDETVSPEEFLAYAAARPQEAALQELAQSYAAYEKLLRANDATDFGDQVWLAVRLLERQPELRKLIQQRFTHILVDEFQDTNYAQFRLLELLLGPQTAVTVVADDDQSIYKWRGAALSNVVKFLQMHPGVRTVVLTDNFRSPQPVLDCAYRLIQFNNPERLEVRQGIDKRLVARASQSNTPPVFQVFDTASSEADWVARTIRAKIDAGSRRPSDIAILVRSNREAELFLRALNVCGVPWQFSGASGLLSREESKLLLSCLKTLADPQDSISWYHVASSALYRCPMGDLSAILASARKTNRSFLGTARAALAAVGVGDDGPLLSDEGRRVLEAFLKDVEHLLDLSRSRSPGQLLYQWLSQRGLLAAWGGSERLSELLSLQTVARFFHQLARMEALVGDRLPQLAGHLSLFEAMGNEPVEEEDAFTDRVKVLTIHKAKGLEFPVVFMVGLIHGRFPTPKRREAIELPEELIRDLLPSGDFHLQEERRLFYVGMTRAKEELYLTCAYDYGGKSVRKVSQFVAEALDLATPSPAAKAATLRELLSRQQPVEPLALKQVESASAVLRLDAHGLDDYLTCPLKYRYSHVLRLPAMRHHLVVYGTAIHKAVEQFFRRRLEGGEMGEEELLGVFEASWRSEGFLSLEHEQLRFGQGREALGRFFREQASLPEHPSLIEEKFSFQVGDVLITGRWDRVDIIDGEAVIIDYKSSEVDEQASADRRARDSLQLLIYSLAWESIHGKPPLRVELRFLQTGITGEAAFTADDFQQARQLIREASAGIRKRDFHAQPQEFSCHWCAFQAICPSAFRPS